MAYTWGEIQINSIKKMFLNNVAITTADLPMMRLDRKYATYLDAMPNTVNEGLLRLMKISRPLVKEFSINYDVPDTVYNSLSFDVVSITDSDYIVQKANGQSYYFEVDNTCVITIEKFTTEWEVLTTITNTATGVEKKYKSYKGVITNDDNDEIRIVFKQNGYLYHARNIAIYDLKFRTAAEVYDNTPKQIYKLKTLIPDFYKINSIIFQDSDTLQEVNNIDHVLYGDSELHVDSTFKGNLILKYEAYPDKIVGSTVDTYIFTMADEMVVLLPLYIASELYKDDDAALAVQYRNQFEVDLEKLNIFNEPEEFISHSNWL